MGSSIVEQKKSEYVSEGLRQLNDEYNYVKLRNNDLSKSNLNENEKVLLDQFYKFGSIYVKTFSLFNER